MNNADTAYAAEMQAYAALCREKLEKVSACRSALEGHEGNGFWRRRRLSV